MVPKPTPEHEALEAAARIASSRLKEALHRLQKKLEDDAPDIDPPEDHSHKGHR